MYHKLSDKVLVFLDIGVSAHQKGIPQGRILKCNLDGSNLQVIHSPLYALPDGIAVDDETGYIYFSEMGIPGTKTGSISRIRFDGTGLEKVVPHGLAVTPKQLVLDPRAKNMYWADREGARICIADYDGSNARVLVQTDSDTANPSHVDQSKWCVGIAIDPDRNRLFWTQKGPSKGFRGQLWSADLVMPGECSCDKRQDAKLLLDNLPEPIHLDLIADKGILLLSDRGEVPLGNTITAVDVNDLSAVTKKIVVTKLHEAIGISYDAEGQKLYMTDLLGGLYSANEDGSGKETLHPDLGELTGITISNDWSGDVPS